MRSFACKGFIVGILLPFSASSLFPAVSGTPAPIRRQDISDYEKRLAQISEQLARIKKEIEQEERRKNSVLATLHRIGLKKSLIKKEIELITARSRKADQELASLQKQIPEYQENLRKEEKTIQRILVTMYKFGRPNAFDYLLRAEDMGDLITESKNLTLLARYQNDVLADYTAALRALRRAEGNLKKKKDELSRLLREAEDKKREYTAQEKKYTALVQQIESNKETHLKAVAELEDRAEQLLELVKKLQREEVSLPYIIVPLYEQKGRLPWPLSGRIVTRFGLHRHPRFNTKTRSNGIEILPGKSTIVKAVAPGRIAFADYFQGYGNLIIIDHGLTYYSLYGHCSEFLVEKGKVVKDGQPIAVVGDFGSLQGDTLYFEIRHKTEPLNPLQWLKRR